MDDLLFEPIEWLLGNPPPVRPLAITNFCRKGDLIIVTGREDCGKSTFGMEMAYSLATGEPFLGYYRVKTAPMKVGLLQAEIDAGSYVERWLSFPKGEIPEERIFVASTRHTHLDRQGLVRIAGQISDYGLEALVLDPLGPLWPERAANGESFKENEKTHVTPIMVALKDLNITVIMIHHDPKPSQGFQSWASGSQALLNDPDVRVHLARNREDDSIRIDIENRLQKALNVPVPAVLYGTAYGPRMRYKLVDGPGKDKKGEKNGRNN